MLRGLKSASFESAIALYIIETNNASIPPELVMQNHEKCITRHVSFPLQKDIWYVESKFISKLVFYYHCGKIKCIDNLVMRKWRLIPLHLNIMLGPQKFS